VFAARYQFIPAPRRDEGTAASRHHRSTDADNLSSTLPAYRPTDRQTDRSASSRSRTPSPRLAGDGVRLRATVARRGRVVEGVVTVRRPPATCCTLSERSIPASSTHAQHTVTDSQQWRRNGWAGSAKFRVPRVPGQNFFKKMIIFLLQ